MKNVIESNKLIAKFMDKEVLTDGISWFDENYKAFTYHENWNTLMPVVQEVGATIRRNKKLWYERFQGSPNYCIYSMGDLYVMDALLPVYKEIVEFIKWYNKTQ